MSFSVHRLASSQLAPSSTAGSPLQRPCRHMSLPVHGLSSLHFVPSERGTPSQLPCRHVSSAVHGLSSSHDAPSGSGAPLQMPATQTSFAVHLPSSHDVPSSTGVCTQPSEPALGSLGSQASLTQGLKLLHWLASSHVKPKARELAAAITTSKARARSAACRCMETA